MKRLKKYTNEIKMCLQKMEPADLQNIILICRDAKIHIIENSKVPHFTDLEKSFRDMEALAENVVSEGQQKDIDPSHTRLEKMKAITCAWDKYFETPGL
jgi:hypothetical protein